MLFRSDTTESIGDSGSGESLGQERMGVGASVVGSEVTETSVVGSTVLGISMVGSTVLGTSVVGSDGIQGSIDGSEVTEVIPTGNC